MLTPSGSSLRSSSTAARPCSKSTPEKVSPLSKASPLRLKPRWSSALNWLSRVNLPLSMPLDSGSRARTPTCAACAAGRKTSAGR